MPHPSRVKLTSQRIYLKAAHLLRGPMFKLTARIARVLSFVTVLMAATPVLADTITVFAASSLKPVFDTLVGEFETKTGHRLRFSFAGSAVLARQISLGAPADVFVSANEQWMDHLVSQGYVDMSHRFDLTQNRLALVSSQAQDTNRDPAELLSDLAETDKMAMGLVRAVPAGQYGKAALEFLKLWKRVEPQIVQVESVRAALTLVHLKEVRLGVVYASDVGDLPDVYLVNLFPNESHPVITYPVAAMGGEPPGAALEFLTFLQSDLTRSRLENFGFQPVQR